MLKKGLGKGLDVLIPQTNIQTNVLSTGRTVLNLPCDSIIPNPYQARKHFDSQRLSELSLSIKEHGIVQPIIVRQVNNEYELVAGERRLRAAKLAGLDNIPAILKDFVELESMEVGLIENLQRENLNPMEESRAFKRLSEDFNMTQEVIAKKVGKSRSVVANSMRLLNLPEEIQNSIETELLTSGHGRTLVSITNPTQQLDVWRQMLEGNWNVRQAEAVTKKSKPIKKKLALKASDRDFVLEDLSDTLSRHLATKVAIKGSRVRGSLSISYFSQEDLERIIEAIS